MRAKGGYRRACQGGDIDNASWLITLAIGKGVAEHEAAFGIGVENFDGEARHTCHDVTGLGCLAARHIFCRSNNGNNIDRQCHFDHCGHCADDARSATHVEFHLVHSGASL